jgi:hypothetical protein
MDVQPSWVAVWVGFGLVELGDLSGDVAFKQRIASRRVLPSVMRRAM